MRRFYVSAERECSFAIQLNIITLYNIPDVSCAGSTSGYGEIMDIKKPKETAIKFKNANVIPNDILQRDREQSHRLHQPDHMISTIDPINGKTWAM